MNDEQRDNRPFASVVLRQAVAVIVAIGVNIGLNYANNALSLPFFLDSIGTAVVAATAGLLPGLFVAVATNAAIEVVTGFPWIHLPFALCGVATALIVWGFVRSGRFADLGGALVATLAVALANSVLGSIIATFVYGGITSVGVDYLVTGLVAGGRSLVSATFWARVPANLVDKSIAVLAAFFLRPILTPLLKPSTS